MRSNPPPLMPFDHTGAEQLAWDRAGDEITCETPALQVFRCAHAGLHRIEVFIEATYHHTRSHLWLRLYEDDIGGWPAARRPRPVRVVGPLASADVRAFGWFGFEFEAIPASGGRLFSFELAAPDAAPGNALSFRVATRGVAGGNFFVARQPQPGALLFRAACLRAPELAANFDRLRAPDSHRRTAIAHRPLVARVEISRPCNLHCTMCLRGLNPYNSAREPVAFMSLPTFQRMDEILPTLLWMLAFGLGEPFLNPHYLAILRYFKQLNPYAYVFASTNGTCLRDETIDAILAEELFWELQVSLDGARAATFEAIRPLAKYDVVTGALRRLVAARERHGTRATRLKGAMLVQKANVAEIFDVIRLMADWGLDHIVLDSVKGEPFAALRAISSGEMARIYEQVVRGHESLAGTPTVLAGPLLEELNLWHRRTGQPGTPPRWGYDPIAQLATARPAAAGPACSVPWQGFSYTTDGVMRVCCNSERLMGELHREPVAKVWDGGPNYRALRTELLERRPHADCASCLGENSVKVDSVASPAYLDGCLAREPVFSKYAGLAGSWVEAWPAGVAEDFSVEIDETEWRVPVEAGEGWRVGGWIYRTSAPAKAGAGADAGARAGTDTGAESLMLAIAVDGVVRGLTVATAVTPGGAHWQWSAFIEGVARPRQARAIAVLRIGREGNGEGAGLSLSRIAPDLRMRREPSLAETIPVFGRRGNLGGCVDGARIERGRLHLFGWAGNLANGAPASRVILLVQGQPVRAARPHRPRPDVAKNFGDGAAGSDDGRATGFGFGLEWPLALLALVMRQPVMIVAVDDAGGAAPLRWGPASGVLATSGEDAGDLPAVELCLQDQQAWLYVRPGRGENEAEDALFAPLLEER